MYRRVFALHLWDFASIFCRVGTVWAAALPWTVDQRPPGGTRHHPASRSPRREGGGREEDGKDAQLDGRRKSKLIGSEPPIDMKESKLIVFQLPF